MEMPKLYTYIKIIKKHIHINCKIILKKRYNCQIPTVSIHFIIHLLILLCTSKTNRTHFDVKIIKQLQVVLLLAPVL